MFSRPFAMALAGDGTRSLVVRLTPAAAAGLLVLAGATSLGHAAMDVFQVADVPVDVTSDTAAKAREQALIDGERLAFIRLLKRLTLRKDHDRLPNVSREEMASYVEDLEVEQEKTSPVRYIAKLRYRFKPKQVRNFLNFHSLPFAETPSKPALVLPVYQTAGALLLWDEPNPWREAWKEKPPEDGLLPTMLARGDLPDIAAIGAEQAMAGDVSRLRAVGDRYAVGDVIVAAAATRLLPGAAVPTLEVQVSRHGSGAARRSQFRFQPAQEEDLASVLKRAVAEVAQHLENAWKEANLLKFGDEAVAAVRIPVAGLADWLVVRKKLAGVAVVERLEVVLLSRDEVRVNIHYIGETEQLATALAQADLRLAPEGDEWVLQPAPAPGRPAAAGAKR